jgi:hypothetical protein
MLRVAFISNIIAHIENNFFSCVKVIEKLQALQSNKFLCLLMRLFCIISLEMRLFNSVLIRIGFRLPLLNLTYLYHNLLHAINIKEFYFYMQ